MKFELCDAWESWLLGNYDQFIDHMFYVSQSEGIMDLVHIYMDCSDPPLEHPKKLKNLKLFKTTLLSNRSATKPLFQNII